ncbi:MAG: hypothetical protein SH817_06970 [Leptospira sp.]|nr:hypothetical protein [Leptospira sp.]
MRLIFLIIGTIGLLLQCDIDTSSEDKKEKEESELRRALLAIAQQAQTIPDCQKNSTATVYFINESNSSRTYDIIWDGVNYATVSPNAKSATFTVASGSHSLLFRFTNTTTQACSPSTPNIAICSNMYYSCSG